MLGRTMSHPVDGSVVVTGAGSGLGLRLAEMLGRRGHHLNALDLTLSADARDTLTRATSGHVNFEEVDVRDTAALTHAFARAVENQGTPGLVINCAGVQHAEPFLVQSEEAFTRVVEINLLGSRNVAAAALEHLRPGGHLVLVASMAGLVANYAYAAYCASKFGVVGLAQVLRLEQHARGIDVSVVCPPEVETPMVDDERKTMLAPTRALKEMAGTLELEPAVQAILRGIDARKFMIIPGRRARFTYLLTRALPGRVTRFVTDRVVARELAASSTPPHAPA